jgi:ribosome-associated translation inhibitor RaiA
MIIVFNSDKNIKSTQQQADYFKGYITDELDRFSEHITRIEVHLSDENAGKTGPDDKRCLLEARSKNRQPMVVKANNNTIEQALFDAVAKLESALDTVYGKMKNR